MRVAAEKATLVAQKLLDYSGKGHVLLTEIDLSRLIEEDVSLLQGTVTPAIHSGLI
jgi:hypothetical protein